MREILFRGKLKQDNLPYKKGEWVYGNFVFLTDGNRHIPYIYGFGEVIPETIGQYAGLTDKNGKKIFEGDIVAHFINWLGKRVNGVVRYESKTASWSCDFVLDNKKKSAFLADWVHGNKAEIIGNIHDNPELLKEADNE